RSLLWGSDKCGGELLTLDNGSKQSPRTLSTRAWTRAKFILSYRDAPLHTPEQPLCTAPARSTKGGPAGPLPADYGTDGKGPAPRERGASHRGLPRIYGATYATNNCNNRDRERCRFLARGARAALVPGRQVGQRQEYRVVQPCHARHLRG